MNEETVQELMKLGILLFDKQLKRSIDSLSKVIEDFEKNGADENEYFIDQLKIVHTKFVVNIGSIQMLGALLNPIYGEAMSVMDDQTSEAIREQIEEAEKEKKQK